MKLFYSLSILFCLTAQFAYGQSKICRPIKISIYQGNDTTLTKIYDIVYTDNKVAYIDYHEINKIPTKTRTIRWDFVRQQDATFVIAGKDTLFTFRYDAQNRVVRAKPKYGFMDYVYVYNAKGQIDSMRTKKYRSEEYGDVYQKFNYETEQEATFKFRDGLSINYKGVSTFDNKKNPFYPNLELCIALNSPYIYYFTPHNTLKTYLLTHIGSIIVYQNELTYNTEKYPISHFYNTLSYDLKNYIFQSKTIYEYECR